MRVIPNTLTFLLPLLFFSCATQQDLPNSNPSSLSSSTPEKPPEIWEEKSKGYASHSGGKDIPKSIQACDDARRRAISEYYAKFYKNSRSEAEAYFQSGKIKIITAHKEIIGDGICEIVVRFENNSNP